MAFNANALIGQTLGGYHLDRKIGIGSAGVVYAGHRLEQPGHQVAIKVLVPPERLTSQEQEDFRTRFLREAATLTRLKHPHILPINAFAADETSGFVYMVTPYLAGGTLADLLRGGPLSIPQIRDIVTQIADALDYAHTMGVIHGDVKPTNVLFDERHRIYLTDFGIAGLLDTDKTSMTDIRQVFGTAGYLAPEQITGEPVSPATDVYGLGTLTYQIVTGQLPFASSSLLAILRQITVEDPPAPTDFRPDLPEPAARAMLRALAKQPAMRFSAAGAFASAFTRGIQGKVSTPPPQELVEQFGLAAEMGPIPDGTPLVPGQQPARANRRTPVIISLPLLLLVLFSSLWIFINGKHPTHAVIAGVSSAAGTTSGQPTGIITSSTRVPANGATLTASPTGSQTPSATHAPGSSPSPGTGTTPTTIPGTPVPPTPTPIPGKLAVSPSIVRIDCTSSGNGAYITVANQSAGILNWSITSIPSPATAAPGNGSLGANQTQGVTLSYLDTPGSVTVSAPGAVGSPASIRVSCIPPTRCIKVCP